MVVDTGTEVQSLGAAAAESLLLRVARDEVLPTLTTALSPRTLDRGAHDGALDETAVQEALRRLGSLAWSLLASMPAELAHGGSRGAVVSAPSVGPASWGGGWGGGGWAVDVSTLRLPFYRPAGLALYRSLVECAYGAADGASRGSSSDSSLSMQATADLEERLLGLRLSVTPPLSEHTELLLSPDELRWSLMSSDCLPHQVTPLSEHTHLLLSLQCCFGRWVLSLRPDAYGAQYGTPTDEETQLRLTRALRAIAKRLHAYLRAKHEAEQARTLEPAGS